MVMYMYIAEGQGQTTTWEPNSFQNLKFPVHLPISCKFCPSIPILTIFPIQMHVRPCRRIGQGHPRVMIYIYFVEFNCLMLHVKFQNHRLYGSGDEDFKIFKGFCYL